jgi:hypothetical protein
MKIAVFWNAAPYSLVQSLETEGAGSSETLITFYQTTWYHISEDDLRNRAKFPEQIILDSISK